MSDLPYALLCEIQRRTRTDFGKSGSLSARTSPAAASSECKSNHFPPVETDTPSDLRRLGMVWPGKNRGFISSVFRATVPLQFADGLVQAPHVVTGHRSDCGDNGIQVNSLVATATFQALLLAGPFR